MPVFAKSLSNGRQPTLVEHSMDTVEAFAALFGEPGQPTRLAEAWRRFFRLDDEQWSRFHIHARLGLWLHDIGKANDGFQSAVSDRRLRQLVYHEHLSAVLLISEPMRSWLERCRVDPEIVLSAVACHHLRFTTSATGAAIPRLADRERLEILDFSDVLDLAARDAGVPSPKVSSLLGVYTWEQLERDARQLVATARRFNRATTPRTLSVAPMNSDEERHRLLLAVRAAVIASDSAGSGLVRTGRSISDWITQTLGRPSIEASTIRAEVIDRRIRAIRTWRGWERFQERAAELGPRVLLVAPCGAGKTLAAWRWIEGQLSANPAGHVLFLYPTRGTATEGFRDYVSWAPEADAALVHGTAEFDLEGMFTNPDDERFGRNFTGEARLFALGHWSKRIFSATVDTFLGAMAYQYGPMCLLPVLADSVVVIDEVHSFSRSMFAALKTFLERFDLPVLCMTASLPTSRRDDLLSLGLAPAEEGFEELRRIASTPRYIVNVIPETNVNGVVERAARDGKRVLWVTNRVDDCQRAAASLMQSLGDIPVHCYHSRYRLIDRRDRHEAVIRQFRDEDTDRGAVVVSTQVCEMSLDLDADVLVTEVAPVPSLIQRMGRCCRVRDPGARRGEVVVYKTRSTLPYDPEAISAGSKFIDDISKRSDVSQEDLAAYLARLDGRIDPTDQWVALWNSGFYASSRDQEFRDSDDYNIECVLDADVERYLASARGDAPGFVLPVPKSEKPAREPRLRYLRVARSETYSTELGYQKVR